LTSPFNRVSARTTGNGFPIKWGEYLYHYLKDYISGFSIKEVYLMSEESKEISSMTVIGIGIVIFVVIVGVWYLFLK